MCYWPCPDVCAGVWPGRWSCWRPWGSQDAGRCRVSLPCGSLGGSSGSLDVRTPWCSPQTGKGNKTNSLTATWHINRLKRVIGVGLKGSFKVGATVLCCLSWCPVDLWPHSLIPTAGSHERSKHHLIQMLDLRRDACQTFSTFYCALINTVTHILHILIDMQGSLNLLDILCL